MGKIIAIANQKGGVGKTTTSVNLSAELALQGKKVLLFDLDPQGNATSSFGIDRSNLTKTTYDIFASNASISDIRIQPPNVNIDLVPATVDLSGIEIKLLVEEGIDEIQYILSSELNKVKNDYDFILIDCPPSLGLITINALMAADSILIPVQCQFLALDGLSQLLNTIRIVQKKKRANNTTLMVEGVLLTMQDKRSKTAWSIIEEVRKLFGDKVFNTVISMNVAAQEAPKYGLALVDYNPKSAAAKEYNALAKELVKNNG